MPYVIGARTSIVVAMDWTDFDADNQSTIMLSLVTDHGRATPLVWLTVDKKTLKDRRNLYEDRVLVRLAEILPPNVKVCILADRGFGDQKLYRLLTEQLHFDYVIRFRGNITVTAASGETRTAAAWVHPDGRARTLRGAKVTAEKYEVGTVVCVQEKDMKQALVPGREQPERDGEGTDPVLRRSLGHRMRLPRYQGSALRHGHGFGACELARAP